MRLSGEQIPAPAHASKQFAKVILKACAYSPDCRYKSAKEFQQALINVREELLGNKHVSFDTATAENVVQSHFSQTDHSGMRSAQARPPIDTFDINNLGDDEWFTVLIDSSSSNKHRDNKKVEKSQKWQRAKQFCLWSRRPKK